MSNLTSRHVTSAHCVHLRHKGMYVLPESEAPQVEAYRDWIEPTAFWCVRTQKAFGPDGRPVRADSCCSGRGCCEH